MRKVTRYWLGKKLPFETRRKMSLALKGRIVSEETRKKISIAHKGRKLTIEHRKKLSLAKKGRPSPKKGLPGRRHTQEEKEKISKFFRELPRTPEWRKRIGESHKGEKCTFWKGGVSAANELVRKSVEYKIWREEVFRRDNFTCVDCGQRGGRLHADHIKPFSLFPELRFLVENGRTMCVHCHQKTDTYGWSLMHRIKKEV